MLTKISILVTTIGLLTTVSCFSPPAATSARIGGVYAPLPPSCPLELINAPAQAGPPPGLEMVGSVNLRAEPGRMPTEPEMLAKVKPEACQLGGEKVSVAMSADTGGYGPGAQSALVYIVWRHTAKARTNAAPISF